nr:cytochrome c3 family protein [Geotalea sp. SG265]
MQDCRQCHSDPGKAVVTHAPYAAGECSSCHQLAQDKRHPEDRGAVILTGTGARLCNQCHDALDTAKNVHGPVASGDCILCHQPHASKNGNLLNNTGMGLCLNCHENTFSQKKMHGPVADGNCLICHDPHQSDNPFFLKMGLPALCFSCHNPSAMSDKSVHAPVKKGNCLACHDPHGSPYRKHLRKDFPEAFYLPFNPENFAICFDCHALEMILERRTDSLTNFRDGDRNLHFLHVNKIDKGRSCKACHDPHAAEQPKLIKRRIPGFGKWEIPIAFDKKATGGTCVVGCHKPKSYDRTKAVNDQQ